MSTAGTSVIRTTNASISTPIARPKPIVLMIGSSTSMKPPKTAAMISAAAVTTRAPCPTPSTVAAVGSRPCTNSSRTRDTMNTS